jgi:hypothetical protein
MVMTLWIRWMNHLLNGDQAPVHIIELMIVQALARVVDVKAAVQDDVWHIMQVRATARM